MREVKGENKAKIERRQSAGITLIALKRFYFLNSIKEMEAIKM